MEKKDPITTIQINPIANIDGLTQGFMQFASECACYCLMDQSHDSGIEVKVTTDDGVRSFLIQWELKMTSTLTKTMNDQNRTTDYGAMALAILFTVELTEYTVFETSRTGSGIDFWLMKEDTSDDLDLGKGARLEVSGIRTGNKQNNIGKRLKVKQTQASKSNSSGTIAYISISEFSTPQSTFVTL